MLRTMTLFFVLGLMVSCASYHNDRSISSFEEEDKYQHRIEPRAR